jgi:hypothetical protein
MQSTSRELLAALQGPTASCAPGSITVNIGAFKSFRGFRESDKLQFRSEFFNLFNRPNFGPPGSNIDALSSFGRITSAADGRVIQFALKYLF